MQSSHAIQLGAAVKKHTIDQSRFEDLSDYLVEVKVKRPHFHKDMRLAVSIAERRFQAGDPLAVHDALIFCERGCLPLPIWLSEAVRGAVIDSLTGGQKGKRGRSNSPLGISTKRLKKEVHFRFVMMCRQIAKGLEGERIVAEIFQNHDAEFMRGLRHVFPPVFWEKIESPDSDIEISDFGDTLESHYLVTSKLLRGTFAQAEPRTIRNSYKEVELSLEHRNGAHSENVRWFADAEPETLEALGLQIDLAEVEVLAWMMGQEIVEPNEDWEIDQDKLFVEAKDILKVAKKT